MILVEAEAEIIVFGREGLGGEKIPDFGFALSDFFDEGRKPTWELTPFGGEGSEPHLPVQTRLEGGDLRWETIGWACFVGKLDGLPLDSVRTALEGEFGAASGHDSEESVAGGEMPRGEGSFPLSEKG